MIAQNTEKNNIIVPPNFPIYQSLDKIFPQKTTFILENFLPIPQKKVTMISGQGGLGKSFLAIQMALRLVDELEHAKVLLWLSEDSQSETRERANQILSKILKFSSKKTNENDILNKISIVGSDSETFIPPINDENYENFENYKQFFLPFNLIVIDPLIAFYSGDENSNPQARRFIDILSKIASINAQSIVLIHHHGKKNSEGNSVMRGASAFRDAIRTHYQLKFNKKGKNPIVQLEKDNVYARQYIQNIDDIPLKILPYDEEKIIEVSYYEGDQDADA